MMGFSISEYGRQAGISASAIRYYEAVGILPPAERRHGRRHYYAGDLPRLKLVAAARKAGFTIQEIKSAMGDGKPDILSAQIAHVTAQKVSKIDAQIAALQSQKQMLEAAGRCGCLSLADCKSLYLAA